MPPMDSDINSLVARVEALEAHVALHHQVLADLEAVVVAEDEARVRGMSSPAQIRRRLKALSHNMREALSPHGPQP